MRKSPIPGRIVSPKYFKNHLKKGGLLNCFNKTRELKQDYILNMILVHICIVRVVWKITVSSFIFESIVKTEVGFEELLKVSNCLIGKRKKQKP